VTAKLSKEATKGRTAKPKPRAAPEMANLKEFRDRYRLDGATLARILGVSELTMAKLQKGSGSPDAAAAAKMKRLEGIFAGLARVMKKSFIPTWLTSPNDACERRSPADLLAQGDFEAIEDIIYFLEAGEPV
jgi:transcriptional regulator with XRE-family HTH domain